MRPHVGATIGLLCASTPVNATRPDGTAKFGWLNTLNASSRSCNERAARIVNDFTRATSALTRPGPVRLLRGRLPRVLTAGSSKQFTSQERDRKNTRL